MAGWRPVALPTTLHWFRRHLPLAASVCLIAAFTRWVQTGGWGSLSPGLGWLGELIVALARLSLALMVLGGGSPWRGVQALRAFFRQPEPERALQWQFVGSNWRSRWRTVMADILLFAALVVVLRLAIAEAVTGLAGVVPSPVALTLFLKNLSVIPLTIVFQLHLAARLFLSDPGHPTKRPPTEWSAEAGGVRPTPPRYRRDA